MRGGWDERWWWGFAAARAGAAKARWCRLVPDRRRRARGRIFAIRHVLRTRRLLAGRHQRRRLDQHFRALGESDHRVRRRFEKDGLGRRCTI